MPTDITINLTDPADLDLVAARAGTPVADYHYHYVTLPGNVLIVGPKDLLHAVLARAIERLHADEPDPELVDGEVVALRVTPDLGAGLDSPNMVERSTSRNTLAHMAATALPRSAA